jgi:cytochrome c peroxidase
MSSKRFATTRLIAIPATVSICLCAFFSALALGEDTEAGAPPTLAPGQAPPLPKAGPLAEPRSQDQIGFPMELTKSVIPPGSPLTPSVVALGEKLFVDSRLSGDGTVACATCHDPALAFTDGRPVSIGIAGRAGQRNAPTILNALYNKTQFWDGRVNTLEEQAALPITNPFEMGAASVGDAVTNIASDADYRRQFAQAFGRDVNERDLLTAIATYERTLASFGSPFDRFIAGDQNAMTDAAKRGWESFNTKARCNLCHALTDNQRDVTVFTDNDFHNIGIGIIRHRVVPLAVQAERELAQGHLQDIDRAAIESETSVLGRFLITKKEADIASFKTPDLRNVLVTRALLSRRVPANLVGCGRSLQQRRRTGEPVARRGHPAAGADRGRDRRPRGLHGFAHQPAIQGIRGKGICAAACSIQDKPAAAGYRPCLRPQACAFQTAAALAYAGRGRQIAVSGAETSPVAGRAADRAR